MFSFFKSNKKHSPDEQEDAIPRADAGPNVSDQDGFTIVNPPNPPQNGQRQQSSMYPTMNPDGTFNTIPHRSVPETPFHYLQGIPFKFGSSVADINGCDTNEIMQLQLNEIMAHMKRTQNRNLEYSFRLERTIVNQ